MKSDELLSAFREEMADETAPYLWSDPTIYRYMTDAQRMFCRLTEGIEDSTTPSVCQLSVAPATQWYSLSPLVLKVRKATRADTGRTIPVVVSEKAESEGIRFDGRAGVLQAFVAGLSKAKLRAWPVPTETLTVNLSVFRLPLASLTGTGQDLEIDEQHHEHLLLWMKHRAYDKQDADTVDRVKSEDFKKRFQAYCYEAKKEQERARRTVGAVVYGGIAMGPRFGRRLFS